MKHRCRAIAQSAVRRIAGMIVSRMLPLSVRLGLVTHLRWTRLPGCFEVSMGMLDDLRRHNPGALHRFLWSNHLAHAMSYEKHRFDAANLNPSRRILFEDMAGHLRSCGLDSQTDIRSVLDVGCSMGYLLRHLEVKVFPSASILHGLDIDSYAVEAGKAHLRSLQSAVKLFLADMAASEDVIGGRVYDVVICCGVLMYVDEKTAAEVVRRMLLHAGYLVGLICLAPVCPGRASLGSKTRDSDGAFVHDMAAMIHRAGGRVLSSKRVESSISGSSPSDVILAERLMAR